MTSHCGAMQLHRRCNAGAQPASAYRNDHGLQRGQLLAQLQPQRRCTERRRTAFERMDERPALFCRNPLDHGEARMRIRREHDLRAVGAAQRDPQRIGCCDHDDFGADAGRSRSKSNCNRMISRADCGDAATVRLGRQPEHIQQRSPCLERPGELQQLELEVQFGVAADRLVQLGAAQSMHWRSNHASGQLRRRLMYLLQRQGRGHIAGCYDITPLRRASHPTSRRGIMVTCCDNNYKRRRN